MILKIVGQARPNTFAFETSALIKATGFREYDARWWFGHPGSGKEPELNLMGVQAIGMGLGTLIRRMGVGPDIVTGHDFRSYSMGIKMALVSGLMAAGARVKDIGLALSPTAYFAQFALDAPSVAMVTASHNENGWTGVKMGAQRPLTFGPEEMTALKALVLDGDFDLPGGGSYEFVAGFREAYIEDLTAGKKIGRKLKVVAACGNGTAGAFAPQVLERIGCDVVPLDVELDHSFPRHNPNPEDMQMLHAIRDKVLETGADLGLGFDGDGDRCGVVDNEGNEIFADKVGVMLARDISGLHRKSVFVVDVKSTGLFMTDPVLAQHGATTDYWKTGHSYIKRRVAELNAIAGFEKSGHFFFNPPIGRGYDDALVTAIAVCEMLDRSAGKTLADLYRDLPLTFGTPTMSPHCPDEQKYGVVEKVVGEFTRMKGDGIEFAGQPLADLVTLNGVRVVARDGTWGLVRASSNKPEIVVVVESPVSPERRREMFEALDAVLRRNPEVGAYNQTF
ncbi:phosphomannomutase/phosphoglucomutase [Mesorhizobium abyssinicae]|uniref:phosphomannomutase/phosphoglucomutase n=1 Tax=Mesorhizobium TaxID=68287 RepID=UPI000FD41AE2|nr:MULTISPECIES: phosphomannomutase/phosphoglucomutase [Mesorhizobium]RVC64644.1 phosphomannomutase/phosphoglucomutase [Mesorhizobium sp. M4B.F.Ca.ET.088.02.2.1]MDX8434634.1 phosphomannomutase/phosphoglucomutase [Mesorhizobium abyssinicae]RWF34139.1 MAG: phosphomannomutase/phosphoglucomutase [Mesorhizobium sp.]RWF42898.1 MAG: phosphomannomutase/phosphoglucomutase [Mesorhizobium sp.]TJW03352.1 MAG: phosphomannomutase/phosphoglucomutase [Mesorhizobium sp.]